MAFPVNAQHVPPDDSDPSPSNALVQAMSKLSLPQGVWEQEFQGLAPLAEETSKDRYHKAVDVLKRILIRLWSNESLLLESSFYNLDVIKIQNLDEKKAVEWFNRSVTHVKGQGYSVALPWKREPVLLPDNHQEALLHMERVTLTLHSESKVEQAYHDVVADWRAKGFLVDIPQEDRPEGYFVPHFMVKRIEGVKTKYRLVFDGSHLFNGTSINKKLLSGPNIFSKLVYIL